MPVVRVTPRTPQQREDARLHQLRFGRWVPPKAKKPTVSTTRARRVDPVSAMMGGAMPLVAAFRDLLDGVRRETGPFTVRPIWSQSPASPTAPPPSPPPPLTHHAGPSPGVTRTPVTQDSEELPVAQWRRVLLGG